MLLGVHSVVRMSAAEQYGVEHMHILFMSVATWADIYGPHAEQDHLLYLPTSQLCALKEN